MAFRPKYKNTKIKAEGHVFDSKKEYKRFLELKQQELDGEIRQLTLQDTFELIPSQRGSDGKVIERAVKYKADFTYRNAAGDLVVEDTKGYKTPEYIIKRKLMLYIHGIRINEL